MAPEQLGKASDCTAKADVWSLAATLLHAVTGAMPYAGMQNMYGVVGALMAGNPPEMPNHLEAYLKVLLSGCVLLPGSVHT